MGFLDRLHKVATGLGGALQAPIGLVKDLAQAPFKDDDDFDGFVNTLYRRSVARGGQFFGNLIGPEEGVGAVFGAAPEAVRSPVRAVTAPVLEGIETIYREGIAEPLSTAFTAGSIADAPGGGGVAGLFRGETWSEAYDIAQDRSPFQAFALMFGTKDIHNEAEVARFAATDTYEIMSGVGDGILRLVADPTVIGGKAAKLTRTKALVKPIRAEHVAEDINRAMQSGRVARFVKEIDGKDAAEIRHQFFPDHAHGSVISTVLAEAPDATSKYSVLRALMGDGAELEKIRTERAGLAGAIERLTEERSEVLRYDDESLFADPQRKAALQSEVDDLYSREERARRMEAAHATLSAVPRVSLAGRVRTSEVYQQSSLARPLHVLFDMRPHHLVNLHDQAGDVQLARMLRKSKLDDETQGTLRSRYMAATSPPARHAVLVEAEEAAVASIAQAAGMTVDEINAVLAQASGQRAEAVTVLRSRVYDGEGRSLVSFEGPDNSWTEAHIPLFSTQEANVVPLVDLDEVRRATTRIGQFRARHPLAEIPGEMVGMFYRVWRPAVLLRPAWPVRILMDTQLRIMAKIGALSQMKHMGSAGAAYASDALRRIPKEQRGLRNWTHRNYEMESAFGAPGDAANVYKSLNSARGSFDALVGVDEGRILNELRQHTGQWRSIKPDELDYASAWEHAVNKQIGLDVMGRKFLEGASTDDVLAWLRSTPEGRAYAARNPVRERYAERWVEAAAEQVDAYVPASLREAALAGRASADELAALLPDASLRPVVHGEVLAQSLGGSQLSQTWDNIIGTLWDKIGTLPEDVLSRNRFFEAMYRAEAERLVDLYDTQGVRLDETLLAKVQEQSRVYALRESKSLLYDLAERSEMAEIVKFISPFYSAWQEVITRWAGLSVENPAFVARLRLVWNAPERAGLIVDENGYTIDEDGRATDYEGRTVEAGSDRYIQFRVPEWAKDMPGFKGLDSQGGVRFNKKSFNMALQGWPGVGPIVQVPVNEIAKGRPDLEASLRFVLPYGSVQEVRDIALPAAWKRLHTRNREEDDRAFTNAFLRIWQTKAVDYNLGKRDTPPTREEAEREAKAFFSMRVVASATLPAAPQFVSPYQVYIDALRQRRELDATLDHTAPDYRSPDEWFLDEFGPEFFPLTESLSKSVDGVPPTLEGWAARKKYRDLIEEMPELGGLIIGADGAGEFNRAVYASQFANESAPGTGVDQREGRTFDEFTRAPAVSLGWIEFSRAMDFIDAERIQRGLPNLQVKKAADLARIKRLITASLAEKYPDWFAEYSVTDRNKSARRIAGMRLISEDPRLAQREDIRGLAEYLKLRDSFSAFLSTRKAKTLTATSNRTLAIAWETAVGNLIEKNLAFGALHHRWLDRDMPEVV